MRPSWSVPFIAALAAVLLAAAPVTADETPREFVLEDSRILESSGLQASRQHPGIYWTHNDSDYAPEIFAVDSATGETVAVITLQGVEFRDVEAIQLGPDGDLYVGDIGDNFDGAWPHVWIYRFAEPEQLADATLTPTVYAAQYDDGPRDAEALLVHPETGHVYLVSKKDDDSGAIYAAPGELSTDGVNVFERMYDTDLWVTDGAFSPDGTRLLLRGYFGAELFRWADDAPEPIGLVTVPAQRQGESVTFTPDGRTLMFGSEGEQSEVEPVPLSGEELPDSARAEDEQPDEGRGEGSAEGAEDPDDGDGEDSADGAEGGGWNSSLLLMTAGAAALVVLALRRALRGSGRRRG
jgi:hypothetical protein